MLIPSWVVAAAKRGGTSKHLVPLNFTCRTQVAGSACRAAGGSSAWNALQRSRRGPCAEVTPQAARRGHCCGLRAGGGDLQALCGLLAGGGRGLHAADVRRARQRAVRARCLHAWLRMFGRCLRPALLSFTDSRAIRVLQLLHACDALCMRLSGKHSNICGHNFVDMFSAAGCRGREAHSVVKQG